MKCLMVHDEASDSYTDNKKRKEKLTNKQTNKQTRKGKLTNKQKHA